MALRVEGDQLRVVGRSAGDQHGVTALGGLLLLLLLLLELLLLLVVLLERRRRRRQLLLLLELLLLVLTRRVAERLGESVCVHRRSTGRERLVQPLDRVTRGSPDVKKAANGGGRTSRGTETDSPTSLRGGGTTLANALVPIRSKTRYTRRYWLARGCCETLLKL